MDSRVSLLSYCCDATRNAFDHESWCLFFRADRLLAYLQRRRHACVVLRHYRNLQARIVCIFAPNFSLLEVGTYMLIWNWLRKRKFSQLLQAGKVVAFEFCRHGHALRPIFMLWLVKIWQVSSCGKFMQHLEACLLIAEADSVLCHLVLFFTVFRRPGSEVWNRVYMIAPVKKFDRVTLSTDFPSKQIWRRMEEWWVFARFFFPACKHQERFSWNFFNGIFGHQEAWCTCMNGSWVTSLFEIRHLGKFSYL